jgi:cytochrome P450
VASARRPGDTATAVSGLGIFLQGFAGLPFFLERETAKHGPFIRFRLGPLGSVFYCGTPEAAEEVLVTKATAFVKGRGVRRLRRALGTGLLTSEEPQHLPNRRLVQPAFHRKRLAEYGAVMAERARLRVLSWRPGSVVDVEREMNALALEIVSETLFGIDLRDRNDVIASALAEAMSTFPTLMIPFSEIADDAGALPHNKKLARSTGTLFGIVEGIVRDHRDGVDRGDVLSMLLASRDDADRGMSERQVRDEALTILLAGHETTANALTWAFYLLQRNPRVEAALHAHLDDVLGDRDPDFDDVPQLAYVRAVFAEAMRLYPPAWITSRTAIADVEIAGQLVPRGSQAIVSQYVMHRDARYWPQPERFDPTRFLGETDRPKFAYFPFGGGTRLCIGESFAWTEGVLALATIARRVRLERVDRGDVGMLPLVTLRPRDPVRARVAAREPGAPQRDRPEPAMPLRPS